jgi:hypothetical protein
MNAAHRVETVLSEDETLMLQGLSFYFGNEVEVIIVERSPSIAMGESLNQQKSAMIDESVLNSYQRS